MNLIIPVDALTILIRAKEPKTNITAKELMMMMMMMMMMKMIYYKLKLVTCNYLKMEKKYHDNHDKNTLRKMVYGPTYVPYNEDGQKLLLPQTTDMSLKDNLKLLYNSLPEGMCDNEYESLEQAVNDVETFQYSHETSTKTCTGFKGFYVGSASPLIADIKTQPYSMLTYLDNGMMTGTYDNTHDIPIYIDNGSTLNIMPTHFYDNAYYLHHLPKAPMAAKDNTNRQRTCEDSLLDRCASKCARLYDTVKIASMPHAGPNRDTS